MNRILGPKLKPNRPTKPKPTSLGGFGAYATPGYKPPTGKPSAGVKPTPPKAPTVGVRPQAQTAPPAVPLRTASAPAPPQPAAAPAALPAQPQTPITPFVEGSEVAISEREKARDIALAAIAKSEADTQREFFDPSNPQSRQAALRRQFMQIGSAQRINQASSGQLYAGSSATEDALTQRDEGFAGADLQKEYQSIMSQLSGQRNSANQSVIDFIADQARQKANDYAGNIENTPIGQGDVPAQEAVVQALTLAAEPEPVAEAPAEAAAEVVEQEPAVTKDEKFRPAPKKGYTHVQTTGPRKGLSYKLVKSSKGFKIRVYENGDKVKDS